MRCFALAEALLDKGQQPVFTIARPADAVLARLSAAGLGYHAIPYVGGSREDLSATLALIDALQVGGVVLDGYQFDVGYRAGLAAARRRVLIFDDLAELPALYADVVVNPSIQATPAMYARSAPAAALLLGPGYAPLRREIQVAAQKPLSDIRERRSLLLTFGGSDPLGLTLPCIEHLAPRLPAGCRLEVVVGSGNLQTIKIVTAAQRFECVDVHCDTLRMGELMARAGLAISAGGGTMAELAALGVATLAVLIADNQAPSAAAAGHDWFDLIDARHGDVVPQIATRAIALWNDPGRRYAMSNAARALVDGNGASRIARAFSALLSAQGS